MTASPAEDREAAASSPSRGSLQRWLERPAISYGLIALLQIKVVWGMLALRDLSSGDTTSYFQKALRWAESLQVDILWSPLYTAYYGTLFGITGDPVVATALHRLLIVIAASLGVLAVLRALLPPGVALVIAAWWAILPINFDTLYEVHLFALLPILVAWKVAASDRLPHDRPWARGTAVALLVLTALLVRNETMLAAALLLTTYLLREARVLRRSPRALRPGPVVARGLPYLVPIVVAVSIFGCFYLRSYVQGDAFERLARDKHALNMCQVYAFGHGQRDASWSASPWTECQDLAEATFGDPAPTLRTMLVANPLAVLVHFGWNLTLLPAGLQLALFNGTWGGANPDYVPVAHRGSWWATALALAAVAVVGLGTLRLWQERRRWWRRWLRPRASLLLAMAAVAIVSVPVILTQRPRPSYLFALTTCLMAVIGFALHVLTERWPYRRDAIALALVVGAILFVPAYYVRHASTRPIATAYAGLEPLVGYLENQHGTLLLGDYAQELRAYHRLSDRARVESYALLDDQRAGESLPELLDRHGVDALFVQPRIEQELLDRPGGGSLLRSAGPGGAWRLHAVVSDSGARWKLLVRERSVSPVNRDDA